jgi:hypothetical protein
MAKAAVAVYAAGIEKSMIDLTSEGNKTSNVLT